MRVDTVRTIEDLKKLEKQILSLKDGSEIIWKTDSRFEVWRAGKRRKIIQATTS